MRKFILNLYQRTYNFLKTTYLYDLIHPIRLRIQRNRNKLRNKRFNTNADVLFKNFTNALNNGNVTYWLDYGTLLGYYRDKDFIKFDLDLDVGAFAEDYLKVRNLLISKDFKLVRSLFEENGKLCEDTFLFKGVSIDVFYYYKVYTNDKKLYSYTVTLLNHNITKFHLGVKLPGTIEKIIQPFSELKEVAFKGCKCYVPSNTDEYLRANYGETYMIPNPNFNYKVDALNLESFSYEDKKGYGIIYDIYW